jgi:hypothetical protein
MQGQTDQMSRLADNTGKQADRTKDLADKSGVQARAGQQAADAATSAANTAKEALRTSERAYVANGPMTLGEEKKTVKFSLVNSGHVPSGVATTITHYAIGENKNPFMQGYLIQTAECHWAKGRVESVTPGSPYEITVTLPKLDKEKLISGLQQVVVAGYINYADGFPDTPIREWPFCTAFRYKIDGTVQTLINAPCDSAIFVPKMEICDKYPANESK